MGKPRDQNSLSLSQSLYILTVISGSNFSHYLTSPPIPPCIFLEFYCPGICGSVLLSLLPPLSDYSLPTSSWAFPCMQSLKCQYATWIHFLKKGIYFLLCLRVYFSFPLKNYGKIYIHITFAILTICSIQFGGIQYANHVVRPMDAFLVPCCLSKTLSKTF